MAKAIVWILLSIFCVSIVFAAQFQYQYSPYTGKLDRTRSTNQSNITWIFGGINMEANTIFNIGRLKAPDGSAIRFGADPPFTNFDQAIIIASNQSVLAGGISHAFLDTMSNKVLRTFQVGKPESAGFMRNSQLISGDFGLTNGTALSNCQVMIPKWGVTNRIGCNTSDQGASLGVQGSLQVGQQIFIGGANKTESGIRSEGFASFFLQGFDFNGFNGSLHFRTFRPETLGLAKGEVGQVFFENFDDGTISPFYQVNFTIADINEWNVVASVNCFNDECARAGGSSGGSLRRTMETNISTAFFKQLNMSFTLSTVQIEPSDLFTVTVNNNSGSGEVEMFSIQTNTVGQTVNFTLPVGMENQTQVTLRYHFQANNPNNEFAFVNDVKVTGNATQSTEVNVTRLDTEFKLGDGTERIFWNDSTKVLELPANTTAIGELDVNVTRADFWDDLDTPRDIGRMGNYSANEANFTGEVLVKNLTIGFGSADQGISFFTGVNNHVLRAGASITSETSILPSLGGILMSLTRQTGTVTSVFNYLTHQFFNDTSYEGRSIFNPRHVTLVSHAITFSANHMVLDTEGGIGNDNLTNINPCDSTVYGARILIQTEDDSRDIEVLQGGNIDLASSTRTLNRVRDKLLLVCDPQQDEWSEVSFSNN